MRIIDNINTTHNKCIQEMLASADHMILVSPFLTEDFDEFIHDISKLGVKSILLVTMIRDNSADLFKKANSLYSFCFACLQNKVAFEIRVDNKLHGKIYVALKDGVPFKGIVTSANFTDNGLSHSHEWGIEIDDSVALQKIIDDLINVCTAPLSIQEIESIVKIIDDFLKGNPQIKEPKPGLNVTKHIYDKLKNSESQQSTVYQIEFPEDTRFFIKPLGATETPFEPTRVISDTTMEIQFSNRKPNQVRIGDILICYGVGVKKLLGYFRIISEPYRVDDELVRWPWRVMVENLNPKYSSNWWSYDNTLSSVSASYNSEKPLTFVGGHSLGALSFGADKIRLNEEFAYHLISVIEESVK